jgi:hypothetical protein
MPEQGQRVCQTCGLKFSGERELCPVCVLRGALGSEDASGENHPSELGFEHYELLRHEDGTAIELGRGGMGVTYKVVDVRLHRLVALKIIGAELIGDEAAQHRFVREARAAASLRHSNVASVFHLGNTGADYFYAMEFVEGETLGKLIRRTGQVKPELALS